MWTWMTLGFPLCHTKLSVNWLYSFHSLLQPHVRVQPTESPLSGEDIFNCPPSVNFPIHFFLAALPHILPEMIKVPSLYFPTPCSQNMGMRSNPSPQNLNRNVMEGFSIPDTHTHAHTPLQCLSSWTGYGSGYLWICSWTNPRTTYLQNSYCELMYNSDLCRT